MGDILCHLHLFYLNGEPLLDLGLEEVERVEMAGGEGQEA